MKITFSNPRLRAEIPDWPLGGDKRGLCVFQVERDPKRGVRISRTTFGKPKYTTYSLAGCIVDGSDGRTYLLKKSYGMITIYRSDFKYAETTILGRHATVSETQDTDLHQHLMTLIQTAAHQEEVK